MSSNDTGNARSFHSQVEDDYLDLIESEVAAFATEIKAEWAYLNDEGGKQVMSVRLDRIDRLLAQRGGK